LESVTRANRIHAAALAIWVGQLFALIFFVGLATHSGWAADHVTRSGRGPLGRGICYLELYVPAGFLILSLLGALSVLLLNPDRAAFRVSPWGVVLRSVGLSAGLVGLSHVGVIRRWKWWVRVGLYAGMIAAVEVLLAAAEYLLT
jgi:hypothetical protein